jgi:hypothetical protein
LLSPPDRPSNIVWVARERTNSCYRQQLILNDDWLIARLVQVCGGDLILVYDHVQ